MDWDRDDEMDDGDWEEEDQDDDWIDDDEYDDEEEDEGEEWIEDDDEDDEEDDDDEDDDDDEEDDEEDDDDESAWERFERIADSIQAVAGTRYGLRLIESSTANASTDGSTIFVTTAAIDLLDDDELAYVIGHELVHNIFQHPARTKSRLTVLAERVVNANGGFLKKAAYGVGAFALSQFLSRNSESLADLLGQEIAEAAGFDPNAAESALGKIDPGNSGGGVFHSHPETRLRRYRLRR